MDRDHDTLSGHSTRGVPDYQQGTRVGIYDLVQSLGRGGMGQVWKAHDTQGHRSVAIKLLPPEFRHNPEAIAQVRSAFQVVHQLNHPCLCKSLGLFEDAQHGPYIVMDYVEGITLSEYRRRFSGGRVPFEQVVSILGKVADALDHAHEKVLRTGDGETKGVLHRDVKPQNIMVLVEGDAVVQVSLIDLGLAAEIRSSTTRFTKVRVDNRGTRPYMSPEQLSGKRSQWDGRTDQYSLAAVAYEMLGGHPPFEADDDLVLIQAIKDELPDPIDGLAPFINAALLKGLSKNRDDRFASCSDFIEALAGHAFGPDLAASGNIPLMAAPLIETIIAIPAPQVAVSELPPLPEDILGLEGRLSGLQVAIDLIDQGKHHEIRGAWKALERQTTSSGEPVIESLKKRIQSQPSCRDSELCALAPEAPQTSMLVLINAFKRLVVLRRDRNEVESVLRKRQMEDFRGIVDRFLGQTEDSGFPLAAWLKLEPHLLARRYVFVKSGRELLEQAEEGYTAILAEREAERVRVERKKEQVRKEQEEQRRRLEREKEQEREKREQQAARERARLEREREVARQKEEAERSEREIERLRIQQEADRQSRVHAHYTAFCVGGSVAGFVSLGGLGWLCGAIGWATILFPVGGLALGAVIGGIVGMMFGAFISSYNSGHSTCCDGYHWGPVDEKVQNGFGIFGAIIGAVYGFFPAIEVAKGVWTWAPGTGLLWGGISGVLIGLVTGLIVAAQDEPR